MKYLQIFSGAKLLKEITTFPNDFQASELLPLLPSDWQSYASQDESFAVIWKPETLNDEEAVRFIEIVIQKNFSWTDAVTMVLIQKVAEITVLDKLGELKGMNIDKVKFIEFLKSFEYKDKIKIASTNPSRGIFYLAVNIIQDYWNERWEIVELVAEFIAMNSIDETVNLEDEVE